MRLKILIATCLLSMLAAAAAPQVQACRPAGDSVDLSTGGVWPIAPGYFLQFLPTAGGSTVTLLNGMMTTVAGPAALSDSAINSVSWFDMGSFFEIVHGTTGNDTLTTPTIPATPGAYYVVFALRGDDTIDLRPLSASYSETYCGPGNDDYWGTPTDDYAEGGPDFDTMYGDSGDDVLYGCGDPDNLWGEDGDDYLVGNGGGDWLDGGDGCDDLWGEDGDDWLWGKDGDDLLLGGNGDDVIYGGNGRDALNGEEGTDELYGGNDEDVLYDVDSTGGDYLKGDGHDDHFECHDGNADTLDGSIGGVNDTGWYDGGMVDTPLSIDTHFTVSSGLNFWNFVSTYLWTGGKLRSC